MLIYKIMKLGFECLKETVQVGSGLEGKKCRLTGQEADSAPDVQAP